MTTKPQESTPDSSSQRFWPGVLAGTTVGLLPVVFSLFSLRWSHGCWANVFILSAMILAIGALPPMINSRKEVLSYGQAVSHGLTVTLLLVGFYGGLGMWRSGATYDIWELCLAGLFFSPVILSGSILGNTILLLVREVRSRRTTSTPDRTCS